MSRTRHASRAPRCGLTPLACTTRAALLATLLAGCTDDREPTGPAARRGLRPSMAAVAAATNGKIAFVSFRDGNGEIYIMNADGSGQTRLTNNPAEDRLPAWSPDGTKIAFSRNFFEIYVMNADGSGQTQLTNHLGNDFDPDWSPDGTKIAYTCGGDICVINVDGSGRTSLTNTFSVADGQPDWSPNGTKIAFVSWLDLSPDIYVMNADGSGLTRLTNQVGSEPDWSPDGTKIAFESPRDGNKFEIYVMNTDGSAQSPLTTTLGHSFRPAWAPDGTKLAFQSSRDGNPEIYVMNADGSGQIRLTNNQAWDGEPAWQPLPTGIPLSSQESIFNFDLTRNDPSPPYEAISFTVRFSAGDPVSGTDVLITNVYGAPGGTQLVQIRNDTELITDGGTMYGPLETANPIFDPLLDGTFSFGLVMTSGTAVVIEFEACGVISFVRVTCALASMGTSDLEPPVVTVPTDFTVEATSPAGAIVTYSASATDNVDPAPVVSCDTPSGATFPLGSTMVTCTATDAAGNTGTASFVVMVVDTTAPVLSLPTDLAVDATSPSGAVVSYTVSATDAASVPSVSCTPASGSLFAIGTHTVSCSATDASGNSTAGSFVVTVKGAEEQITDFQGAVTGLGLEEGTEMSFEQKLAAASSALARGERGAACGLLQALIDQVNAQSGKKISAVDAAVLIAEAERIRAVLGC